MKTKKLAAKNAKTREVGGPQITRKFFLIFSPSYPLNFCFPVRECPCSSVAKNFAPTHPGEVLLEDVLKPLGLTITGAAQDLGVNRKTLSAMVKGKCSLTTEMAIRIAHATGTSPESWLNMQTKLNLWQALKNKPRNIVLFPRLDKVAM